MTGLRRMTPELWREVREGYTSGTSAKELAERFPVAVATIYKRACMERWRDLVAKQTMESAQ